MVSRFVLLSTVLFLISGCASTQLNHNTMDLASTTDDLLQRQVLHNLERFIDSDAAIPAQIVITSGAASTTNSLTPSISAPFANSVVQSVTPGKGVTGSQLTRPAITGSLSASDTWSQNRGFAPIMTSTRCAGSPRSTAMPSTATQPPSCKTTRRCSSPSISRSQTACGTQKAG